MVELIHHHPLAPLNTWHVGGEAALFYQPTSFEHLSLFLQQNRPAHYHWLGLGSNILVPDEGVPELVVATRKLTLLEQRSTSIYAQAGVTSAKLARFSSRLGFAKAAFFAGIPGTIGGALAMNAGAFGGETWEWVKGVWVVNRQGEIHYRTPADFEVGYREVNNLVDTDEAFVAAEFVFPKEPLIDGMDQIKALLRKRNQSQPIGTYNCGSVFRNPPGDHAARLIEACDLKGYQVGDAIISPKHANFIINLGQATAKDILTLMQTIEDCVSDRFNIALQREVKLFGQSKEHALCHYS